ncbi:hypothetical protein C1646_761102 [Rhizophagus diaphanus]|nr:hypothetical protein C1646_761102 [Rhizophagus diaphanus] [Rhizophagus sp. MUCL 43196]
MTRHNNKKYIGERLEKPLCMGTFKERLEKIEKDAMYVDGTKYPEAWNNLPFKLYPIVSLYRSGCIRIQSHQKIK